jgi:hypothetical protein
MHAICLLSIVIFSQWLGSGTDAVRNGLGQLLLGRHEASAMAFSDFDRPWHVHAQNVFKVAPVHDQRDGKALPAARVNLRVAARAGSSSTLAASHDLTSDPMKHRYVPRDAR